MLSYFRPFLSKKLKRINSLKNGQAEALKSLETLKVIGYPLFRFKLEKSEAYFIY